MKTMSIKTTLSCITKYTRFLETIIKKKIIFGLFIINFLGACASPTAMLGPVYTFSSTGNIFQTGFSYGSSELVKIHTGKTPLENMKEAINVEDDNIQKKTLESEDFLILVSNQIKKTNGLLILSN